MYNGIFPVIDIFFGQSSVYSMDWSHELGPWSGFLERNLGGKFWSGTENAIPVMKESVAVFKGILLHSIKTRIVY